MTRRGIVLIPMAGEGSRFTAAGYRTPKPFIDVLGRPMVRHVIDNVAVPGMTTLLVARRAHVEAATAAAAVASLNAAAGVCWSLIDAPTEGTACTVLGAIASVDEGDELLIANSDQLVDGGAATAMVAEARARSLDGSIMVFRSPPDPKWSYARLGGDGLVERVAEKVPISPWATVGIYWFRTVRLFREAAEAMIAADDRVNNEFYTCPVYNYVIAAGGRVGVFEIASDSMHGLGTPADLEAFLGRARDGS
jgi:NDP-sugar pyrophosphorylase family protein